MNQLTELATSQGTSAIVQAIFAVVLAYYAWRSYKLSKAIKQSNEMHDKHARQMQWTTLLINCLFIIPLNEGAQRAEALIGALGVNNFLENSGLTESVHLTVSPR